MAQGAKPGEGGQFPGHKVDAYIAQIRRSTPGVGPDLAAPAPRHLLDRGPQAADLRPALREPERARLGEARDRGRRRHGRLRRGQGQRRPPHDLRPRRRHRRLAAVLDPCAGIPWEIGLAETQQTLLLNDLRSRVRVEVDGQMKTGRDVVIGALLGADEFGFSTAPLIAMGCIMMRVCHLNTCPVGIATQDPELRRALPGHAGARRHLHAVRRRGGAQADGQARHPPLRGSDRPHRPARDRRGDRALEGARRRPLDGARRPDLPADVAAPPYARPQCRCSTTRSTGSWSRSASRRSRRASG